MNITAILLAAAIVGGAGLFIGIFLGVSGKNSQLKLMKEKRRFSMFYLEITVEAAVMRAVQIWRQQLPKGKRRSMPVRWAVSRLEKRSQRSWA